MITRYIKEDIDKSDYSALKKAIKLIENYLLKIDYSFFVSNKYYLNEQTQSNLTPFIKSNALRITHDDFVHQITKILEIHTELVYYSFKIKIDSNQELSNSSSFSKKWTKAFKEISHNRDILIWSFTKHQEIAKSSEINSELKNSYEQLFKNKLNSYFLDTSILIGELEFRPEKLDKNRFIIDMSEVNMASKLEDLIFVVENITNDINKMNRKITKINNEINQKL
ncbi:MAG: hypothetical protein NXI20_14700 [bacterium]|nr:hypothetical protein [bacterium]